MSIQSRLSLAFGAVIVLALVLAGTVFVALRRGEREQQALEHLAAVAPQVTLELRTVQRANAGPEQVADLLRRAARDRDVRVLLVDQRNVVTQDSGESLVGKSLQSPAPARGRGRAAPFRTWRERMPEGGSLVFLSVPQAQFSAPGRAASDPPDTIVLAVPEETVARAWRELLPGLLWAGVIALICSLVAAALLARSIARPLVLLTRASEGMAQGQFEHDLPAYGSDEVGRLARAFNLMAREVGRSQSQMRALIANVSHDLKTPLTSVLGFSQALRDGDIRGKAEIAETSAIIYDEAQRVQALVDDLLFLSAIEAGQAPVLRDSVALGALAERVARRFAPRFADRGITFHIAAAPAVSVRGDTAKLERILDNLLDNALKYTDAGGRATVTVDAGADARVRVFNTAPFIPEAELARLFDRFYRLDRARSSTSRGSGLGLAIARELAELHGGAITAESTAEGITLTLRLPLAQAKPGAAATDGPASAEALPVPPQVVTERDPVSGRSPR